MPEALEIELAGGEQAIVDFEDWEWLTWLPLFRDQSANWAHNRSWMFQRHRQLVFYRDYQSGRYHVMGRLILGLTHKSKLLDFINGDVLDHRRSNLAVKEKADTMRKVQAQKRGVSGYRGVVVNRAEGKPWKANIFVHGKAKHIGLFATPEEAARAYDRAAREHLGDAAVLNFPDEVEAHA